MEIARFFYKDLDLACSLYAQFFSGLLENITQTSASEKAFAAQASGNADGRVDIPFAGSAEVSGEMNITASQNNSKGKTEQLSPHDLILLDVMSRLRPSISTSASTSKFGDVVYLKGFLYFIPKELEAVCIEATLDAFLTQAAKNANKLPKNAKSAMQQFIRKTFQAAGDDPRFYFSAGAGEFCTGYMKQNGLMEGQLPLFYKHGSRPIPAHMMAISEKNEDVADVVFPQDAYFGQMMSLSSAMQGLWSQGMPSCVPVLPLTIFHPVNITDQAE